MVLLGQGGLLKDIILNLRYSDWCGGLPFQWNDKLNKLEMKSPKQLNIFRIRLWIAFLFLIAALIQVVRVFKRAPLMVVTHSVMFLACGTLTFSSHLVNFKHIPGIVQLCNSFISFEQNFSIENRTRKVLKSKKPTNTEFFLRCMIYLLTITGITMPVVYHLDVLRNPCLPMYVGFWMSSQCPDEKPGYHNEGTWGFLEILTKFGISLFSYLNWSLLLVGCCFQISLEYIMEGNCFRIYVAEFGK